MDDRDLLARRLNWAITEGPWWVLSRWVIGLVMFLTFVGINSFLTSVVPSYTTMQDFDACTQVYSGDVCLALPSFGETPYGEYKGGNPWVNECMRVAHLTESECRYAGTHFTKKVRTD